MSGQKGSIVHPASRRVPVVGGQASVEVRPWTMAQRAALRPRITTLLAKVLELEQNPLKGVDLPQLFELAEDEIAEVVRASVHLPPELAWDELSWEDLPVLAQAVWEICIARPDGGLGGKVARALAGALTLPRGKSSSPPRSRTEQSSAASPS
ncbi:MAG: hypothetical protein ACRDTJ_09110 [Pseudonocardiaceae bacterium]